MFRKASGCGDGTCVEVDTEFRVAAGCGDGTCVEVGVCECKDGHVLVRDSKDPEGAALMFTRDEWRAFVTGVKLNEFDV